MKEETNGDSCKEFVVLKLNAVLWILFFGVIPFPDGSTPDNLEEVISEILPPRTRFEFSHFPKVLEEGIRPYLEVVEPLYKIAQYPNDNTLPKKPADYLLWFEEITEKFGSSFRVRRMNLVDCKSILKPLLDSQVLSTDS